MNIEPQQYNPPFLIYDEELVYPTVKGSAARGGYLDVHNQKEIVIEFNCLGVEGTTTVTLQINLLLHRPLRISVEKRCPKSSFVEQLETALAVEEEEFGFLRIFLMILLFVVLCFVIITICGLLSGRSIQDSLPCACCYNLFVQMMVLLLIGDTLDRAAETLRL